MYHPKFFFRKLLNSLIRRLQLNSIIFSSNRSKLAKSIKDGSTLVDIMPGINLPMIINPKMYFSKVYNGYVFESGTIYFIKDYLRSGQTVLDVGANVGYFALLFSQIVGKTGQVIAFEPGDFSFNLLKQNKDLNQYHWLKIYQAALGEKDKIVDFNSGEPGMDVYNSLGDICHPSADTSKFKKIQIQQFKGDNWFEQHNINSIDLMKIDVEGGEYGVIKGMLKMFENQKISVLLIEITYEMSETFGYRPSDIILLLKDFGYQWFYLQPAGNLVPLLENNPSNSGMFVAIAKSIM